MGDLEESKTLDCSECTGVMFLTSGLYGPYYSCENFPNCKVTHGAHPNGDPLGVPADKETRAARVHAHAAFDKLWNNAESMYQNIPPESYKRVRRVARNRAYQWLQEVMGLSEKEAHIGSMDIARCFLAIDFCNSTNADRIRVWAKSIRIKNC